MCVCVCSKIHDVKTHLRSQISYKRMSKNNQREPAATASEGKESRSVVKKENRGTEISAWKGMCVSNWFWNLVSNRPEGNAKCLPLTEAKHLRNHVEATSTLKGEGKQKCLRPAELVSNVDHTQWYLVLWRNKPWKNQNPLLLRIKESIWENPLCREVKKMTSGGSWYPPSSFPGKKCDWLP